MRPASSAQALVEFGLVLPVLLILLVGTVSLGRGLVYGVGVQQGAREAARLGASAGLDVSITDSVVLDGLVAASAPALAGCHSLLGTSQQCGGGTWTFAVNVQSPSGSPVYGSLAAARSSNSGALSGWRLEVLARGNLTLLLGFDLGGLGQVGVQGDAVMVIF